MTNRTKGWIGRSLLFGLVLLVVGVALTFFVTYRQDLATFEARCRDDASAVFSRATSRAIVRFEGPPLSGEPLRFMREAEPRAQIGNASSAREFRLIEMDPCVPSATVTKVSKSCFAVTPVVVPSSTRMWVDTRTEEVSWLSWVTVVEAELSVDGTVVARRVKHILVPQFMREVLRVYKRRVCGEPGNSSVWVVEMVEAIRT